VSLVLKINDRIQTRTVEFWNEFNLSLRFDSVASAFSFRGVFNPNNPDHKEMFCVGHDHVAMVEYEGKRMITGYVVSHGFTDGPQKDVATFGGYSTPGFLEDCNIAPPQDGTLIFPSDDEEIDDSGSWLQMDGMTLREIAAKLIKPFGLQMVVHDSVATEMDAAYEKATAEPGETVKAFLTKLAAQKNVIITHNEWGHLVFTRTQTKRIPILNFDSEKRNIIPFDKMDLGFNGQAMHSHIFVVKQPDDEDGNAGQSMIRNPYVPFVYRPRVIVQSAGDDIDTELAAKNALADELRGMKLVITTDRWDYGNGLILPNNLITVKNPEVYLYDRSTWFIEQVDFVGNPEKLTTTITCCLPEVYSGETPSYLWKGINVHRKR
jgi:prophage tail gpP-like protein